jgi:hypothetical protein
MYDWVLLFVAARFQEKEKKKQGCGDGGPTNKEIKQRPIQPRVHSSLAHAHARTHTLFMPQ